MKMIGCVVLLLVGLSAADKPVYAPQGQYDQQFGQQFGPQFGQQFGQQYYQQASPDLTYGPPELPGTNPQGPTVVIPGVQYPTWQWPQKHTFKKPVTVYQPAVHYKPFHIPKPHFVPVIKPFPIYKPNKPTFGELKDAFVSNIEGIKYDIASKIAGKVTAFTDKVEDKVIGLKVIGTHIGDEIKQIGTAVGSAVKFVKDDFYHKKHTKPHYVLVPARPAPKHPTYTYVQPPQYPTVNVQTPSLTYGAPELH